MSLGSPTKAAEWATINRVRCVAKRAPGGFARVPHAPLRPRCRTRRCVQKIAPLRPKNSGARRAASSKRRPPPSRLTKPLAARYAHRRIDPSGLVQNRSAGKGAARAAVPRTPPRVKISHGPRRAAGDVPHTLPRPKKSRQTSSAANPAPPWHRHINGFGGRDPVSPRHVAGP
jgi:hypothetical protein